MLYLLPSAFFTFCKYNSINLSLEPQSQHQTLFTIIILQGFPINIYVEQAADNIRQNTRCLPWVCQLQVQSQIYCHVTDCDCSSGRRKIQFIYASVQCECPVLGSLMMFCHSSTTSTTSQEVIFIIKHVVLLAWPRFYTHTHQQLLHLNIKCQE